MTIEENLARLDEIISKLDNKDTSLEDAFKEYESGIKLVKECNDAIDKVEKDVITLNGGEDSDKDNDI
ncbi:MAG TPA: exodeoxyribonuclease VII small subunit [Lachnospiraceae bacterium]|jgi:exodeoxyribonuclease VII small subunit|nr:exodeoxyribonuclease VII small subunit [Lachnospiraceae bacterium]CDC36706.1 exodeoxyribonuclease 7 small subunit [Butyrivibrio sp. CAG:318]HJI31132.1 exodeoxyribonuclease VII small subunit [Lachnospiraceae bacterium]